MQQPAILEAFAELSDSRQASGRRHSLPLVLALFTMAVVAGNQGFLAIGDWLNCYRDELTFDVSGGEKTATILQHNETSPAEPGLPKVLQVPNKVF